MKVNIVDWLQEEDSEPKWNAYVVEVAQIATPRLDDPDRVLVTTGMGDSVLAAEVLEEAIRHYIDTFPGAENRLRLVAGSSDRRERPSRRS